MSTVISTDFAAGKMGRAGHCDKAVVPSAYQKGQLGSQPRRRVARVLSTGRPESAG